MKAACFLVLMAGAFFTGCGKKSEPAASSTSGGNPVTAPADYLGAVAKGKQSATKSIETTSLNKSIQLFYAQEGRYPKSLAELVRPDYLPKLPEPPPGMKFDYNPATGEVKVVAQ